MSKPTVWSEERLQWLFSEIVKVFSPFDKEIWGQLPAPTKGFPLSTKEINEIFKTLYSRLTQEFQYDGLRAPKSFAALKQQVQWATTNQKIVQFNGQMQNQRRNRRIAYDMGFMSMKDIVYLEEVSERIIN